MSSRIPGAKATRFATLGLGAVLSSLAVFGMTVAVSNSRTADDVIKANRVSQDFERARFYAAEEESLERKYRLDPSPELLADYDDAARSLSNALGKVAAEADGVIAEDALRALAQHEPYLAASRGMFAAVDAGDSVEAARLDNAVMDPAFDQIRESVTDGADRSHDDALGQLERLQFHQRVVLIATAVFLIIALAMLGLCISVIRRFRNGMEHQSLHDGLTSLPNRALFSERLSQSLLTGGRNGSSSAVLFVDLDRFKEINDTLGHALGDELLRQIGPRLAERLRDSDTVARLGGDEFAVLLTNVSTAQGALEVAHDLAELISKPFSVGDLMLNIEASIGVAVSPDHGTDAETLMQHADVAMYVAKEANSEIALYAADLDHNDRGRLQMLGELRHAIETGQLIVYYQPKGRLPAGEVVGVEALVRWRHPERGMIPPDEFIPFAERTSLIQPLTEYVLRTSLEQCRTWLDEGLQLTVAVNLSARSLLDGSIVGLVRDLLADNGVPASLLELEITESAVMVDPERARELLVELARMGVHIAIDDFGTGYSSLAYLKTLPVHTIKIDRGFVMGMQEDANDAVIVHSVIDLGRNLGLTIVAEGLEDEISRDQLAAAGCHLAQGYLWSRPLPPTELASWLEDHPVLSRL